MSLAEKTEFKFSELSDEAKERARDWWREGESHDAFYAECVIEEAVEQGELMGIEFQTHAMQDAAGKPLKPKPCIWWSGFCSQGDGACFEGSWSPSNVKADKVAEGWGDGPSTRELKRICVEFAIVAAFCPDVSFTVKHSGHYYHEHCTDFDFQFGEECGLSDDAIESVEEALAEAARDFMQWIYSRLEEEYDYVNSDECVDERLESGDYLFTEDGEQI